jgi:hypothetical protein
MRLYELDGLVVDETVVLAGFARLTSLLTEISLGRPCSMSAKILLPKAVTDVLHVSFCPWVVLKVRQF